MATFDPADNEYFHIIMIHRLITDVSLKDIYLNTAAPLINDEKIRRSETRCPLLVHYSYPILKSFPEML